MVKKEEKKREKRRSEGGKMKMFKMERAANRSLRLFERELRWYI